jgi:cytochrome b subunit of formate dehydrogenase
MSKRAKLNYVVDVVIGLAFVLSALSGLVLFFAPSGYQGGRNPYYLQPVLFLSTQVWDVLHVWGSIAMIAGVGAHLVLHWNWMVGMTGKLLARPKPVRAEAATCPIE